MKKILVIVLFLSACNKAVITPTVKEEPVLTTTDSSGYLFDLSNLPKDGSLIGVGVSDGLCREDSCVSCGGDIVGFLVSNKRKRESGLFVGDRVSKYGLWVKGKRIH